MSKYLEALRLRAPEKYLLKTFKSRRRHIAIDEWYFRLHYLTTVRLIILFIILVTVDQFSEKSIRCDTASSNSLLKSEKNSLTIQNKFIDTYCFIQTTFSVPAYVKTSDKIIRRVGLDGALNDMSGEDWKLEIKAPVNSRKYPDELYYAYYQWVPFFLLFQAILFFVPHYIWKNIESYQIKHLLQSIHTKDLKKPPAQQDEQIDLLTKYIWSSIDLRAHQPLVIKYLVCELLNLVVLICNIQLTNVFVNYEFTSYGLDAIFSLTNQDPRERTDPMIYVFPRITKCSFSFFGHTQTVQKVDMLCFLKMNMTNEKVYIFLWFWFILLLLVTSIGLVFRVASMVSTKYRMSKFGITSTRLATVANEQQNRPSGSMAVASENTDPATRLDTLIQRLSLFDWIFIRFIQMNLDDRNFRRVLTRVNHHRLEQVKDRQTIVFK